MRTKLLSTLLISSLLVGSLPTTFAQEVVTPVEPVEAPVEESPIVEAPIVIEAPVVIEEEPATPDVVIPTPEEVPPAELTEEAGMPVAIDAPPVPFELETAIDLPNGCSITDSSGVVHLFPVATSTEYLAVCALVEAVENGTISGFTVENASFGLYVTSVNGVVAAADEYWSLWLNNDFASCGIACLPLQSGDSLELVRTSFAGVETDRLTINVTSLVDEYANIVLPNACSLTDSSGVVHSYPEEGAADYLAACALVAAQEQGYISSFATTDASFGLYVTSVNGIVAAADEYWSLWLNGGYASCGVECLPLELGDVFSLVLTNFDGTEGVRTNLRVLALTEVPDTNPGDGGAGGGGDGDSIGFDFSAAYDFLETGQDEDGSWDSELVTAWAAFAVAAPGAPSGMKSSLTSYFREEEPNFSSVRDYERHAMALMALNINPYTGGPDDYITPIVESFDGTQIDDEDLVNDDVFALIPLLHAGYDEEDEMIQKITAFIVSEQKDNGSWENSVDITGAALQALSGVRSLPGVSGALSDGTDFLRASQQDDGGFGDPFSTSWAIQGIEAVGQSAESWDVGENDPLTYLADEQEDDGGLTTSPDDYATRAWATAYAIPAAKGLTWDDVMRDFKKSSSGSGSSDDDDDKESADTATSTDNVLPETEILVVEPVMATSSESIQNGEVLGATTTVQPEAEKETVPEEVTEPETQPAAVDPTGAWSWLKKLFSNIWSAITGIF